MNIKVDEQQLYVAAAAFGFGQDAIISKLGNGLINKTFLVQQESLQPIVLQQFNKAVFSHPEEIQNNYLLIAEHLHKKNFFIPSLATSKEGNYLWTDANGEQWRTLEFIENTFSPDTIQQPEEAYTAAKCFSEFTSALVEVEPSRLHEIIPDFHNLSFRSWQFEMALRDAGQERLQQSHQLVNELKKRKALVDVYTSFSDEKCFPTRIMHHDCKISNILFDSLSKQVVCPIDLDTVMPGKFFSDVGDMIRTMCCKVDENSTEWNSIYVREEFYEAVTNGYSEEMNQHLTSAEKFYFHYSGLIMIYMQALRFLTDFLNDDMYYKVTYTEQNLNRAKNQLLLLQQLESFLQQKNLLKPDYPQ